MSMSNMIINFETLWLILTHNVEKINMFSIILCFGRHTDKLQFYPAHQALIQYSEYTYLD